MPVPERYVVPNLREVLDRRERPTITVWNRLEGRPRRDDFARALAAEVRDPLWMLTRQWQIGEFQAEDAGSPIFAKVRLRSSPVTKVRAGGATEPYDGRVPLEARVERQPLAWSWGGHKMRLDLRAQAGRQWARMLAAAGLGGYLPQYRTRYAFTVPPRTAATDQVHAHRAGYEQLAALAGRAVDGGELLAHLARGGAASAGITLAVPTDGGALDALGGALASWFARLYLQPSGDGAWKPSYLEHQVACAVPQAGTEVVLSADEYAQGHLDWFSFDRAAAPDGLGGTAAAGVAEAVTITPFIPAPVAFEGMPDARWWALEDRKTDFGAVKPSTTELAQLLLMEFGLVYSNDWFLLPVRMPAGTLARVEGLAITNNFGERTWISAAGAGTGDAWHRWGMFQLASPAAARAGDPGLFIPPATARTLDGEPLEEVELARDEVANMVWAIERVVPTITGRGRAGKDEARETRRYHEALVAAGSPQPIDYAAAVAYQAMTSVPEHWIPFLPVHVPGSVREIQLQRGRMPRVIPGAVGAPAKVPPRTTLIRHGLDRVPAEPYFLHEEEVPRAGAIARISFRRTRWTGGEACVWLGARKQVGRGERGSGLAFDALAPGKPR